MGRNFPPYRTVKEARPSKGRASGEAKKRGSPSGLAFGGNVVVILGSGFVTSDLAIQLVGQLVNGGVEISVGTLGKQVAALDVHIALGPLASFLFFHVVHCQQDFYVHYLVEMPGNPIQLACHIAAQCGGNFKMVTADRQVHKETPFPK
jgi:hypothetical protein